MKRIADVQISNFGPFEEARVDFSKPGLTMVEGQMEGNRGCDSNGAGKSMLFEAVVWCLFGKTMRGDWGPDEVVRRNSDGGTEVAVAVTDTLGSQATVIRYRNHPKEKNRAYFFVDGKDCTAGTVVETNEVISQHLGIDYTAFLNSVAFGARQDVKSFFAASDSERKALLDKLLGLEIYEAASVQARAQVAELERDSRAMDAEVGILEARIDTYEDEIDDLGDGGDKVSELREELASVCDEDAKLVAAVKAATRDSRDADAKLQAVREKRVAEMEHYNAQLKQYHRARDAYMDDVIAPLISDRDKLDASYQRLDREIKRLSGMATDEPCPTCKRPLTVKSLKRVVGDLEKEAQSVLDDLVAAREAVTAARGGLQDISEPAEPSKPKNLLELERASGAAKVHLQNAEARLLSNREKQTLLKQRIDDITQRRDELKQKCAKVRKELDGARAKFAEMEEDMQYLQFWVTGFGNKGLKSFLIEAEMPEINRLASQYAARLLGEGAYIKLSPTRELKSKRNVIREELSIEARIPGCTDTYGGASKGQRQRLDLCLLLAFREIMSRRSLKPFDQFFGDELFDGMDASGVEVIIDLLRETSQHCPVALITHDPRLKDAGDRCWTVVHRDGVASVQDGAGDRVVNKKVKRGTKRARRK